MDMILRNVNSLGKGFVEFAVPMLIQSSVVIVLVLLADGVLRNKVRASLRHCLWVLVLVQLALPTWLLPRAGSGYWPGAMTAYAGSGRAVAPDEAYGLSQASEAPRRAETGSADTDGSAATMTWQGAVFLVWLVVVATMGLLLVKRAISTRRLIKQAGEANLLMKDLLAYCCKCLGVKRKVRLKVLPDRMSPAVCGLFRPVVLVPQNLAPTLGSRHLRALLFHEVAHIKRGDVWVNLGQSILHGLYFYNPLLWLAALKLHRLREQAVDETVLGAMGERARGYSEMLADVARLAPERPASNLRSVALAEVHRYLAHVG